MSSFASRTLRLFEQIHPLDRIARAGYVLRGVTEPENVAAHSHFLALLTMLVCDEYPGEFDSRKAVTMALIHDLPEALMMDIPVPSSERYLRDAKLQAEQHILEGLFEGFSAHYGELNRELDECQTAEARLVQGLDKAQMMIKILMYEREQRGRLSEFWSNPKNFDDRGVAAVSHLFDALCAEAGRPRPSID
jgi:putative hydrolases of HD superfamily